MPCGTESHAARSRGAGRAKEIGISRARLRESFGQAYFLRRRFTALDLAARCGLLAVLKPIPDQVRLLRDEVFTSGGPVSPMAQGDPIALMQADKASIGVVNGTYITNLEQRTANYFTSIGLKT